MSNVLSFVAVDGFRQLGYHSPVRLVSKEDVTAIVLGQYSSLRVTSPPAGVI